MSDTESAGDGSPTGPFADTRIASPGTQPESGGVNEPSLRPGDTLGRYQIRGLLGTGGMGQVFAAFDPELGRTVALKLIRPDRWRSARMRSRLLPEARALARLQHPHVVAIHDVGTDGEQVFLAMERVAGETLAAWLAREPRPWRAVRDVFLLAGRGLAAAHAAGIVHRDFKPSNVVVGAERVVVVDFGLANAWASDGRDDGADDCDAASVLDVSLTLTGEQVGTLAYMAPEQLAGEPATPLADQFAFATAMWTALHGVAPYGSRDRWVLAPAPRDRGVPARVQAALARALAVRPEDRWPRLDLLLAELGREPPARRRLLVLVAAVAVAVPAAFVAGRRTPDLCGGGAALAAAVWDDATRARARTRFAATGHPNAAASFERVDEDLHARVGRWAAAHRDTCEATHVRQQQSEGLLDLRMACLENERGKMLAFTDAMGRDLAAADVDNAVTAGARAMDFAACRDAAALQAAVPPPRDPEAAARVAALRADLDRIYAQFDLGRTGPALERARELVPRARAAGYAPLLARALFVGGKLEAQVGDVDAGIEMLYQAARVAGEARDDTVHAYALLNLIRPVGVVRGRIAEAERLITLAEGAAARAGEAPDLHVFLFEQEATYLDRARHDGPAGLARLQLALGIALRAHGPEDAEVGNILTSMGAIARSLGYRDEAMAALRRAGAIIEARLGPDHPNLAYVQRNLGALLLDQGDYDAAGRPLEETLARAERISGPVSQEVALSAAHLAAVRLLGGRIAEARALADRAAAVGRQVYAAGSPAGAAIEDVLAYVLIEEDDLEGAIAVERRAIAGLELALGAGTPAVVDNLIGLGGALLRAGRVAEARQVADRARSLVTEHDGDPELVDALTLAGRIENAAGRHAEARAALDRALTLVERAGGGSHPVVTEILIAGSEAALGLGERARAAALAERAHAMSASSGPFWQASAGLALARVIAAEPGGGPRAVALAQAARGRLAGTGYTRARREIDAWMAIRTN